MHFRPKYMILYVIILAIGFPISGSHTAKADNPVTKADSRYLHLFAQFKTVNDRWLTFEAESRCQPIRVLAPKN